MEGSENWVQLLKEHLSVWNEMTSICDTDNLLRLSYVSATAGELSSLMYDHGLLTELSSFVENIPDNLFKKLKANEKFLFNLVKLHIWQRKYEEARSNILEGKITDHKEALNLWFQSLYAEKELEIGRPLSAVTRFRIRQRNRPPSHICPEDYKINTGLPVESKILLRSWFAEHKEFPYPSKEEVAILAEQCNISILQVKTWFANARRKMKSKNLKKKKLFQQTGASTMNQKDKINKTNTEQHQVQCGGLFVASTSKTIQNLHDIAHCKDHQELVTPPSQQGLKVQSSPHQWNLAVLQGNTCPRDPAFLQKNSHEEKSAVLQENSFQAATADFQKNGYQGDWKSPFITAMNYQETPCPTVCEPQKQPENTPPEASSDLSDHAVPYVLNISNLNVRRMKEPDQLQLEILDLTEVLLDDISTGQTAQDESEPINLLDHSSIFSTQPFITYAEERTLVTSRADSITHLSNPTTQLTTTCSDGSVTSPMTISETLQEGDTSSASLNQHLATGFTGSDQSVQVQDVTALPSFNITQCTLEGWDGVATPSPSTNHSSSVHHSKDSHRSKPKFTPSATRSTPETLSTQKKPDTPLSVYQPYTIAPFSQSPLKAGTHGPTTALNRLEAMDLDQKLEQDLELLQVVPNFSKRHHTQSPGRNTTLETKTIFRTKNNENKRRKMEKGHMATIHKDARQHNTPTTPLLRDAEQQEIAQVLLDLAMNYNSPNSQGSPTSSKE